MGWVDRFWSKVAKGDECWEWTASLDSAGYGQLSVEGKPKRASRLSCILHHGPPPEGKNEACHTCDNRKCVRPDHLYWGDRSSNITDARDRNRNSGRQRLTMAQVQAVRDDQGTLSMRATGRKHGISHKQVSNIWKGKQWAG
ncbi:hypothetical protein [Providencia phage PSTNGR1]|uniref:HNH nuclease domain-containing protein n=1 Tax=Providencia phage PSTNGR1 TaxID=2783542 RepID=A0A873WJ75_9CAUD|nr:hypothetical protein [Providencia phage PSTNGR1]